MAGLWEKWMRSNARRRFEKIRPYIEGGSLLDVGAAEGWIGKWAQLSLGIPVDLVDVIELNRTNLAHHVYNGEELPFPDDSHDTVTVLLTLHHCRNPARVLAEAARVAKKRLIVTESVYRTRAGRTLLTLLDGGFNGFRAKGAMAPALHFKTVGEWQENFAQHGLDCVVERWFSRGLHEQRLFVLDVPSMQPDTFVSRESLRGALPEGETSASD